MMTLKNLRKIFKKKAPASTLTIGINATSCQKCAKFNRGVEIYAAFDWCKDSGTKIIGFDRATGEITVDADGLMRIIQMVNPVQQPRSIRLVSQDEFYGHQ